MFWNLIIAVLAIDSVLPGVVKKLSERCSSSEFPCPDGQCVGLERVCDNVRDCADGADETVCLPGGNSSLMLGDVINRGKRQSSCKRNEWQCRDGSCIPFYGKCDGLLDCPDGSDETHALCRHSVCQDNLFRCTYGACVDGTAPCNGEKECADNSDELLSRCLNESRVVKGQFKCDNGQQISVTELCDGEKNCEDGSDEKIEACAGKTCPSYLFQCAYGACVDAGSDCNDIQECADGSDESDELCNRTSTVTPRPTTTPTKPPASSGACTLPSYPANGRYEVRGRPFDQPGQRFNNVLTVTVNCDPGYAVNGNSSRILYCFQGADVSDIIPKCERFCALTPHHSVVYECETKADGGIYKRSCKETEFVGTVVVPTCRAPNYRGSPTYMECTKNGWNHIAKCSPGLAKNGTNITILVKDKVEVYIGNFEYDNPSVPNKLFPYPGMARPVTPSVFDIDESDWRFGSTNTGNSNTVHDFNVGNKDVNNKNETINVNVKVENSKVKVTIGDTVLNIGN